MSADRCPTCDRPKCPNFPTADYHTDDARTVCPGCIATDDCRAHAVDWRARCLAAEAARAEAEARLAAIVGAVRDGAEDLTNAASEWIAASDNGRSFASLDAGRAGMSLMPIIERLRAALPPAPSGGEKL